MRQQRGKRPATIEITPFLLVNGTPPSDIKAAYEAILLQLTVFNQGFRCYLRVDAKKRKKDIKKRLAALKDEHANKLAQAKEQENLLNKLQIELAELESLTGNVTSTYGPAKDLSAAIEDRDALNKITERVGLLPIDQVADKSTRDAFAKRADVIRTKAGGLAAALSHEINKEDQLLRDGQNMLNKLNEINARVVICSGGKPEYGLLNDLLKSLRKLRKRAEAIDSKMQAESPHVRHGLEGENLTTRVDQLQDRLIAKRKDLEDQLQLATLVSVIGNTTKIVTEKVEALAIAFPDNLNDQQQQLEHLAARKRALEDLVDKLPKGPEADKQREKVQRNLSRLGGWLKKLNDAVGEKTAALAAYLASKRAANDQLNKLNADVDAAIAGSDDASLRTLQDRINALDAAETRLAAIRAELTDEKLQLEHLDSDPRAEVDNLRRTVDATADKLKSARGQLQSKLNAVIAEQLKNNAIHHQTTVTDLVGQGYELLDDSPAIPISFKDLADKIHIATDAANRVVASAITESDKAIVKPLADIIPVARAVKEAVTHRHKLCLDFAKERDIVNCELEKTQACLDAFNDKTTAGLVMLDVAEEALECLRNARDSLDYQEPTLEQLKKLSELNPLDCVYVETRFVETDWNQLNRQLEETITELGNEITAAKFVNNDAAKIVAEIEVLESQILTSDMQNLLDVAERTIPTLETKLHHLAETETDGGRDRRYVARASIPAIHARLEALTVAIVGRISQMNHLPSLETANVSKNSKMIRSPKTPTQKEPDNLENIQSEYKRPLDESTPLAVDINQVQQQALTTSLMEPSSSSISQNFVEDMVPADTSENTLVVPKSHYNQPEAHCNRNPTFTVVILGRSNDAKLSLLQCMCCVLQNETFEAATSQTTQTDISEMPEEYIIQHETDHIRFVNIAVDGEDYENADIIGSKLSEYPEIHGIITVITNNDSTLPDAQYNQLCFTYKLLFRNAFKKCCIVNVFKPTDTFSLDAASAQLKEFVTNFCERHRLTDVSMNFFCVDADFTQNLHISSHDETQRDLSRIAWQHVSNGLKGFLEVIKTDKPLKARSFHLTAKLRRLENWLNIRRREIPTPPPVEWRFLMEMVADSLMTGLAIYYRKRVGDAALLTNDQLQNAVNYWQATDAEVAKILLDIKQLY